MKIIIPSIFLILLALSFCVADELVNPYGEDERSISGTIVSAIENIREQMPCGFPDQGLPPLAPLEIYQKDILMNMFNIQLNGSVFNFTLNGLNDFEIEQFKLNLVTSKITFKFVFNNITLDTLYDLKGELQKAGLRLRLEGNSYAMYSVRNMTISGSMKYSFNMLKGTIKVKSMAISVNVGSAASDIKGILGKGKINEKMNKILGDLVPQLINQNEAAITRAIEAMGVPFLNKQLEDVNLNDLIGGESPNEKPQCKPTAAF